MAGRTGRKNIGWTDLIRLFRAATRRRCQHPQRERVQKQVTLIGGDIFVVNCCKQCREPLEWWRTVDDAQEE